MLYGDESEAESLCGPEAYANWYIVCGSCCRNIMDCSSYLASK